MSAPHLRQPSCNSRALLGTALRAVFLGTLLLTASLPAQGEPAAGVEPPPGNRQAGGTPAGLDAAAQPAPDAKEQTWFEHDFGRPGEKGAFRVWFERLDAGVRRIWLLDHYATTKDKQRAKRGEELSTLDFYEICSSQGSGQFGFTLVPDSREGVGFGLDLTNPNEAFTWEVAERTPGKVVFRLADGQGLVLERAYIHRPEQRELEVVVRLLREAEGDGLVDGSGVYLNLSLPALNNPKNVAVFGNPAKLTVQLKNPGPGAEALPLEPFTPDGLEPQWRRVVSLNNRELLYAGTTNRFFGGFAYPLNQADDAQVLGVDGKRFPRTQWGETPPGHVPWARFNLKLKLPPVGGAAELRLAYYLGPKSFGSFEDLAEHERFLSTLYHDLEGMCPCAIPLVSDLGGWLLRLLGFFESIVGNWGIAIMLLTLVVRGALAPLNFRMQKSMRKYGAKMAVLKPKMDELKKQHAKDPKAYQMAMAQFMREHKVTPPVGGCLPIFLTMPVWLGLFTALRVAYELRHEAFFGWIDDLSRPDALFSLGNLDLFIIELPYLNVLPFLMMFLWWYLSSRQPLPEDPQQRQVMQIMRFMPLVMGVLLYNYAAALMVYMCTSSLWGIVEQRITKRILGPVDPKAAGAAPMPMM